MSRKSSRRHARPRRWTWIATVAACAVLGGAWWFVSRGFGDNPDKAIAEAREHLTSGESAPAIVLLRAALQARPKDAVARELLGQAYLQAGDPAGAVKELRRAIALGRESADNLRSLARAHLLRGEFDLANARLASARDDNNPDWQLLSADVLAAKGAFGDALSFYERAIVLAPARLEGYLGLARAHMGQGDLTAAEAALTRATEREISGTGLWLLQGELGLARRRFEDARSAFDRVLQVTPTHEFALFGAASAALGNERFDTATELLDRLPEMAQEGPRALFLRAMVAAGQREPEAALNLLRRVLAAAPAHAESLRQAARLHFQLAEYGPAEHMLRKLLKQDATDAMALRMLEAVQLASGQFDGGAYDLNAIAEARREDPQMLALLGAVLMRSGDFAAGERVLSKAAAASTGSLALERQLLLSKLASAKFDEVLAGVPALKQLGDKTLVPDMLLVAAHIGRKDPDAALVAARALVAANPQDPYALNTLAFVHELADQREEAVRTYEQALAVSPGFDGALLNLARLDLAAGEHARARERYRQLLEAQPEHALALEGLALLAMRDKDPAQAVELWQQARRANPDALRPRLQLARQARERGAFDEAVDYAREAYQVAPYAPGVQLEYCLSLLAAGRHDDAVPLARLLATRYPDDGTLARLLAIALARNNDADGLREVLSGMAETAPDNLDARVALARLALHEGKADEAARLAAEIGQHPKGAALGHELRGDAAAAAMRAGAAADAYARAFELAPTRARLLKLDDWERRAGRPGRRLEAWLRQHPDDLQVQTAQARHLQAAGDDQGAIALYERVLAGASDSAVIRNNLAWLYRKIGDGRALEMAEQAYKLAPKRAEIVDTYGWILLEQGRHEQAVKILEQALTLAPENPDIRFHWASALERTGREEDALRELDALLRQPGDFESRALAEQLRFDLES